SDRAQRRLGELSVGAALLPATELAQMFPLEQARIAARLAVARRQVAPVVALPWAKPLVAEMPAAAAEPTEPAVLVVLAVQIALRLVLRTDGCRTQAEQQAAARVSALRVPVAAGLAEPAVAASVLEADAGFAVLGSAG